MLSISHTFHFARCIISEGKPRESYPRYSSSQRVREFEQRENNNNEFYNAKRDREYHTPERNFQQDEQPRKEMRGEEQRARDYSYDRGREVPQYITEKHGEGRNFMENDIGAERTYRKSVGDASVSLMLSSTPVFFKLTTLYGVQYQFSLRISYILFIGMRKEMCF